MQILFYAKQHIRFLRSKSLDINLACSSDYFNSKLGKL